MGKFNLVLLMFLSHALYMLGLEGKEIVFFADTATRDTYKKFLQELRDELQTSALDPASEMQVLRNPANLPANDRYFEVEIAAGEQSVTLGIDRTNLYIVGYRVSRQSYFFSDEYAEARNHLFLDTVQNRLPFSGSYPDLGNRSSINLGFSDLANAVRQINYESNVYAHRRHLVIIIQMISEAARFRYIEGRMRWSINRDGSYGSEPPSDTMLDLENNWGHLSRAVQEAEDGAFRPGSTVTITNREGNPTSITSVRQVILEIAVMLFVCSRPRTGVPGNSAEDANNYQRMVTLKDATCTDTEVSVNIVGRDGMCVDVRDGKDNDGNPLQIWPCHSQDNQKWTLKEDGTIRALGKCMTAYGYRPGQYVMLYDCRTAVKDATLWNIWLNGTIVLAKQPLVLSAEGSNQGTTLTVETNLYAARQGWLPTAKVELFVISIIGMNDLCLEGGTSELTGVWIDECSQNNLNQRWAVYGDGSVRKNNDRNLCLTSDGHSSGDLIILRKCSGWADQRWFFQADGSILNPGSGLVMDVRQSNPSLRQIIIYPPTLNPNQKWEQFL